MKKQAYKSHSWLAVFAFIPLLLISVSGSILVFKLEIDRALMPEATMVGAQQGAQRMQYDALLERVNAHFPKHTIGTWEVFDNGVRADALYLIELGTYDWSKVYVNQYTGDILSKPVGLTDDITDWLVEFHYTFLLHESGMLIGAVFALIMLLLAVTGLIMHRKVYALIARFKWKKAKAAVFSDLHKLVGVVSSPVLLLLAATGLYWNIMAFIHEVEDHAHHANYVVTEPSRGAGVSLDKLVSETRQQVTDISISYISFAYEPDKNIALYGSVPTAHTFDSNYTSGAMFDPESGELVVAWDGRDASAAAKVIDSFRHIHFGVFGGMTTRIIWALVGLMPLLLAFTGLYLWAKRRRKKRR